MTVTCYDYLTLGDGDFSFSLDMCRFLQVNAAVEDALDSIQVDNKRENRKNKISIVCTGIDKEIEVKSKYRDADFITKQIMSLNGKVPSVIKQKFDHEGVKRPKLENCSRELEIFIQHGINAILPWETSGECYQMDPSSPRYRNVIFNHPHIGREDAQLHTRFLSHLFHSAYNYWLSDDGILHLTLVIGQCDRWKAIENASKHGLVLLARETFKPPPPVIKFIELKAMENKEKIKVDNPYYMRKEGNKSRYQYRRHQSGKSFTSRTKGSETLSFAKLGTSSAHLDKPYLPWQHFQVKEERFDCNFCSKSFVEERSRKNHVKNVHGNSTIDQSQGLFACDECDKEFSDKGSLQAHHKAKHSGEFTNIKPDWTYTDTKADSDTNINNCEICGYGRQNHFTEFIPRLFDGSQDINCSGKKVHHCKKCHKVFKDRRALAQHANSCK